MSDFGIYFWFFIAALGFLYLEFRITMLSREMDKVVNILEVMTELQDRADADLAAYIKEASNG